jgi:polyketide biosynthesis enoyl-CoA hydratase PksI
MSEPIIELKDLANGVVQMRMQDRANQNMFTNQLICGLTGAFATINRSVDCKAVILTGYDDCFSGGGSAQSLRDLFGGKFKFTGTDLYNLALKCPVPVIAAMQGHGIGNGFTLGLCADFTILDSEGIYSADFMKYGITPGMGSTFILPKKLGFALAGEMMLSALSYRGEELQKRGICLPVLPRDYVFPHSLEFARSLAEKPRALLVALKDHMVASIREQLPRYIDQELAMHQLTFQPVNVK